MLYCISQPLLFTASSKNIWLRVWRGLFFRRCGKSLFSSSCLCTLHTAPACYVPSYKVQSGDCAITLSISISSIAVSHGRLMEGLAYCPCLIRVCVNTEGKRHRNLPGFKLSLRKDVRCTVERSYKLFQFVCNRENLRTTFFSPTPIYYVHQFLK